MTISKQAQRKGQLKMKKLRAVILLSMGAFLLWTAIPSAEAGWGNLFEGVKGLISGDSLQEKDIAAGLKEALRIGADNSVTRVGQIGGYLDNPKIRIPLPSPWPKQKKCSVSPVTEPSWTPLRPA